MRADTAFVVEHVVAEPQVHVTWQSPNGTGTRCAVRPRQSPLTPRRVYDRCVRCLKANWPLSVRSGVQLSDVHSNTLSPPLHTHSQHALVPPPPRLGRQRVQSLCDIGKTSTALDLPPRAFARYMPMVGRSDAPALNCGKFMIQTSFLNVSKISLPVGCGEPCELQHIRVDARRLPLGQRLTGLSIQI